MPKRLRPQKPKPPRPPKPPGLLPIIVTRLRPWILASACFLAVITVLSVLLGPILSGKEKPAVAAATRLTAPEFPEGLSWLNTRQPLTLRDLRGKVVLLDFWTYACINCQHVIPDLKRLEAKYPKELVVIGVHSAKFPTEKGTDNIRQAVLRHGVRHAVVNDKDFEIWRRYTVKAWPTLVLIDPAGKIVLQKSGENAFSAFDGAITDVITDFDQRAQLTREPLTLHPETVRASKRPLAYPGKIVADDANHRLIVADTNHNRIVVLGLPGHNVQTVIGSGAEGAGDGNFEAATFHHPQGLAVAGDRIFVADTDNHLIRQIDLVTREVTTLAGNGKQVFSQSGGKARQIPLNSPWDLVRIGETLYVAMAGNHQIWALDLKAGMMAPYAGSGREARHDGTLTEAALAQPSGITTDGKRLYVADSETSSIRWIDLPPGKKVGTVVGVDLFEFGDHDGTGNDVRLQHPLGITWHGGKLYVADTYNNKIKVVDPDRRTSFTFAGTGPAGEGDGMQAQFDEPGGLAVADNRLYVADTNNHLLRWVALSGLGTHTVALQGLNRMPPPQPADDAGARTALTAQRVRPGDQTLRIAVDLPRGYALNRDAPSTIRVAAHGSITLASGRAEVVFLQPTMPLMVPVTVTKQPGQSRLTLDVTLYYCQKGKEALCYVHDERLELPVSGDGALHGLSVKRSITPP
ncbi:MAG: redoxin domain-containing protein [Candidatus Sericytochromatia bacterium]|nr:redoxin domain-containing protein [Candidatus Sericytochromatia bacterium]